jgi:DNA-binding IclR family transcriptional regulator
MPKPSYLRKESLILNALSTIEGRTINQVAELTGFTMPTVRRMLGLELTDYVEKQGIQPIYYTLKS